MAHLLVIVVIVLIVWLLRAILRWIFRPRPKPLPPAPPSKKPRSVFVSYRRQDSPHITGRIYDRLSAQFGKDAVFKDVDANIIGLDFREQLQKEIGRCSVLVAVIGKKWNEHSATSLRMNQTDYLHFEIETALKRGIPVIPVLVDGVEMPTDRELPPGLTDLAYRQGVSVRPDPDFNNDINRLLQGIEDRLK